MAEQPVITVQPLKETRRAWAIERVRTRWASQIVVSRGVVHDVAVLPGFVAMRGDEPVGLATYHIAGDACEIVTLESLVEGIGAGTALIDAVRAVAQAAGCRRLWLITTNDNLPAIRFYQKRGFHLVAVYPDALTESRRLKPEIPHLGFDNIPIRDELVFEIML
jgi:ribosomal protein S18 acetylase RimI-like enzyme